MVFEYPTNYSNGTIVDGVYDMFLGYPSYILNGWLAMGFTLLVFVSVMGYMIFSGSSRAITTASFISFIVETGLAENLATLLPILTIVAIFVGLFFTSLAVKN